MTLNGPEELQLLREIARWTREAALLERLHDLRLVHPMLDAAVDDDRSRVTKGVGDTALRFGGIADHA